MAIWRYTQKGNTVALSNDSVQFPSVRLDYRDLEETFSKMRKGPIAQDDDVLDWLLTPGQTNQHDVLVINDQPFVVMRYAME